MGRNRFKGMGTVAALVLWVAATGAALGDDQDIVDMSLEELMSLEIVSASKRMQPLDESAAAVYVITGDEIRRNGYRRLPDILRLAPGLFVARVNGSSWGVTARGFNGRYANKLLVLIDGRSVYSTTFAGVFWEQHNLVVEDIERIEVIRGPGATVWGANAVNGVINIITRSASQGAGGLLALQAGNEKNYDVSFRFGDSIDPLWSYKVYGNAGDRDGSLDENGNTARDVLRGDRVGVQLERTDDEQTLRFEVERFSTFGRSPEVTILTTPPFRALANDDKVSEGGHLASSWTQTTDESTVNLRAHVETDSRVSSLGDVEADRIEVEYSHSRPILETQVLTWGVLFSHQRDRWIDTLRTRVRPRQRSFDLFSGFVQYERPQANGRTRWTFGSKFEHNDFSGFEVQPSVRLLHQFDDDSAVWAALSRAVRTPSRAFQDLQTLFAQGTDPGSGLPLWTRAQGNPNDEAEDVLAFELGYRTTLGRRAHLDVTAFYNDYEDLLGLVAGAPEFSTEPIPSLQVPLVFDNVDSAESYGLESLVNVDVGSGCRLTLSHTYLDLEQASESDPSVQGTSVGNFAENQIKLKVECQPGPRTTLAANGFWIDEVPGQPNFEPIPAYTRVDLHLQHRLGDGLYLAIGGRNLIDDEQVELADISDRRIAFEQEWYGHLRFEW